MYVRAGATGASPRGERQRKKGIVAGGGAVFSPCFFHPCPFPSFGRSLPPTLPPPGENSDDHALRCVFFLSFLPLPLFLPLFCPSSLSLFFFILSLFVYRRCPCIYVYRRNSMYILYARTPDQPLSCIHARLFGQM